MRSVLVPPPLRPGDTVRIIAPSGPFDAALVWRGIGWLSSRYHVQFDRRIFERQGYLAGPDAHRLAELNSALACPTARAIIAARGGYGLGRIVGDARLDALREHPKWLVGFSDITALHVELNARGIASLHAHNVAGIGRGDAPGRELWLGALEASDRPRILPGLACWHPGRARGPILGGNLTVLFSSIAAGRVRLPEGAILVLEDVGEAPYRIDRMLTALIAGEALRPVAGLVLGEFTDCAPGRHGVTAAEVLRERLVPLGLPLAAGLPVGHGRHNLPIHLGFDATLDAGLGRLEICPPRP
jgi:muramoyltetrapeptide carboxypeptidase